MKDLRSRFGFHCTPFTREIGNGDRFPLAQYDDALGALLQTIEQRMSCALIAPAGTGKTALLRAIVERLPDARYRTHYVKVTGLSKRDMCREIAAVLGLPPVGSYPSLVRKLQELSGSWFNTGKRRRRTSSTARPSLAQSCTSCPVDR